MTTDEKLLQQSLEALEQMYLRAASSETIECTDADLKSISEGEDADDDVKAQAQEVLYIRATIAALRERLAQPTEADCNCADQVDCDSRCCAKQPSQRHPLFKPLIDKHPGLSEELKELNVQPPSDPVTYNGWVLREVLFDNGEPVGHREPPTAKPQEPDLSGLKPETQKQLREWLADGTFAERAIGVLLDQERSLMAYEKAQQPLTDEARDAARYQALKTRHRYLMMTRLLGHKGYSSEKADALIDAYADAAIGEVAAYDSMSQEEKERMLSDRLAELEAVHNITGDKT